MKVAFIKYNAQYNSKKNGSRMRIKTKIIVKHHKDALNYS
jgi:hypothetical protein